MKSDSLSFNGTLLQQPEQLSSIDMLLGTNYIYSRIHTIDHKGLFLREVVEICEWSYQTMYGARFGLDFRTIERDIENLLVDNRYPMGSAAVMLYLFPTNIDANTRMPVEKSYILSCREQLLYVGYQNWHSGVIAEILPYDIPFGSHQTSASLTAHKYAEDYVRRRGVHIVLRENSDDIVVSASEYPLFGVVGREIRTAPLSCGVPDSIERVITISVANSLGLNVVEVKHTKEEVTRYDEMFYVTPQGVTSIVECDGYIYPNIIGHKIGDELEMISFDSSRELTENIF